VSESKKNWRGKIVAVDIDNTLCCGTLWEADQPHPRINTDLVALIKRLDRAGASVFLFTARGPWLAEATYTWMLANNLAYPLAIRLKPPANVYIDDRAWNPNDYLESERNIEKALDAVSTIGGVS